MMKPRHRHLPHQLLLLVVVAVLICFGSTSAAGNNSTLLNPTLLRDKKSRCLLGNRASYSFINGSGDGLTNWLVVLPGGGWCENFTFCLDYGVNRSTPPIPFAPNNRTGITSIHKLDNPVFYNWNKAVIRYCDGSSFTGNSKHSRHNKTVYFRGARIFNAAMKELLDKGMGSATNAVLAGESAGGVATMLHCDKFRDLFPTSTRVKCLSDAGYFFPAKRHNYGNQSYFLSIFQGLIRLHRSGKTLPTSCTHIMSPPLCFFAQNVGKSIKTPIFFLMSQFDFIETSYTTGLSQYYYSVCVRAKNCSSTQIKIMQDLRKELLDVLPKESNASQNGFLILSNPAHTHLLDQPSWHDPAISGTQESIAKLFGDWYFNWYKVARTPTGVVESQSMYGTSIFMGVV